MNHIAKVTLNILDGLLAGVMEFTPGLNIISGENGTFKTKLLQVLKQGSNVSAADSQKPLRAIRPKRNTERRQAETIIQAFRQQNRTLDTTLKRQNISRYLKGGAK